VKVVDADAHMLEGERTWDFLDPEFEGRRPVPLRLDPERAEGLYRRFNAVWLIDGQIHPKLTGRGYHIFGTPPISIHAHSKAVSIGSQDMTDVPARLADMDQVGIYYQVVYPSAFLIPLAEDPRLERALCQSYNRFMAQACEASDGRIRFAAVTPLRDVSDAVAVVREAKGLGAVSVMVPGLMWDRPLSDEGFYPLYEELSRLELPLGVHVAWGAPGLTNIFSDLDNASFSSLTAPALMGFWSLMVGGIYERFPQLKAVFLEAGCEWLPYLVHQLERRYARTPGRMKRSPAEYLRQGNIYVSAETDEDLCYVLECIGEDQLVLASDYAHVDPSTEMDMVRALEREQQHLAPAVREKMLATNAARLYDLAI
jgi:predicted TIM-barrel fold metal-dependent hydrolase